MRDSEASIRHFERTVLPRAAILLTRRRVADVDGEATITRVVQMDGLDAYSS